jgi:membrane protease YdiL (CAAX protease family)
MTDPLVQEPGPPNQDGAQAARKQNEKKDLWLETGVVFVLAVLPYIFSAFASLTRPEKPRDVSFTYDRFVHLVRCAQVTIPVLYLMLRSGEPWSAFGFRRPKWLVDVLTGIAVWAVAVVLARGVRLLLQTVLSRGIYDAFSHPSTYTSPALPHNFVSYALLCVATPIGAFTEELVTRAYLIPRLEKLLHSTVFAVLLSTSLFVAWHLHQGPAGAINALCFGIVLAAAFCLFRCIWPLALAHTLHNLLITWTG